MVSWVATASARIVESTARLRRPDRIPVSATTRRTASLIRCGRSDFASRLRQYTSVVGSNPLWSNAIPVATFHRRSHRAASAASRSDRSCRVCSTRIEAITDAGIDGRPRPEGNRSSNSWSPNKSWRWAAKNANILPSPTRCPTNASASNSSRSARSTPSMHLFSQLRPIFRRGAPHYSAASQCSLGSDRRAWGLVWWFACGQAVVMAETVTVNDVLAGHVGLDLECMDRIYLNGYVPNLQVSGQVASFMTAHLGYPIPSPAIMDKIGTAFRRAVDRFAADNKIPVVRFGKDDRKIDRMRPYLARQAATGRAGGPRSGWRRNSPQCFWRPSAPGRPRECGSPSPSPAP